MPYIGRSNDKISNVEILTNLVFDGSSPYSITKNSVPFTPNSAQSCLISIDGVVQATNFSVNSSTIDFGVAIPSTSTCNFFLHYGTGVMTLPSDGSVTTAKLGSNAVSSAKMFSGFANGITMADQWRLTANVSANVDPIASNLERVDDASWGGIGTGMTESSGIFTFPSTGIYLILVKSNMSANADSNIGLYVDVDSGSGYDLVDELTGGSSSGLVRSSNFGSIIIDVTNTSNFKIKFRAVGLSNTSQAIFGNTDYNRTTFTFIRLGDT